jgi:hypothetical protein
MAGQEAAGAVASQSRPATRSSRNGTRPISACVSVFDWCSPTAAPSRAGPSGPSTGLTGDGSAIVSAGCPVAAASRSRAPATPSLSWLWYIHRAYRPPVPHPPG